MCRFVTLLLTGIAQATGQLENALSWPVADGSASFTPFETKECSDTALRYRAGRRR